jgi:ABC-2 type transport system permease protein
MVENTFLTQVKAHFYKHWVELLKNAGEWEWIVIYPLVHIFSIGFLALFVQQIGTTNSAAIYLFIGAFAWNFYVLCQRGITYGSLREIWAESVKHSVIAPAGIRAFILGNGMYGLFTGLVSAVLMHLVAIIFFSFDISTAALPMALGMLVLFIYGVAEGLLVNAVMMLKGPEYMALTWITTGIIMVLSAVYYPLEFIPEQIRWVSQLLPTTYAIQTMRAGFIPEIGNVLNLAATGIALALVYLTVAAFVYQKAIQKSRENGTVLRL